MARFEPYMPQQQFRAIGRSVSSPRPEEVYNTERHLLYVACTRAGDYLLVSGVEPVSEFVMIGG